MGAFCECQGPPSKWKRLGRRVLKWSENIFWCPPAPPPPPSLSLSFFLPFLCRITKSPLNTDLPFSPLSAEEDKFLNHFLDHSFFLFFYGKLCGGQKLPLSFLSPLPLCLAASLNLYAQSSVPSSHNTHSFSKKKAVCGETYAWFLSPKKSGNCVQRS